MLRPYLEPDRNGHKPHDGREHRAAQDQGRRDARFRNLLVRRYREVDDTRVLGYARRDIGDLEAYLLAVGRYLAEET
ncbi:MAG: hypothetical protein HY321_06300 [Armatimonadetes bacterium]|nr:hypothetical protein [Armatimonadota bacterium]